MRNPRISSGVIVLRRYYNVWLKAHRQEPCDLAEFRAMLEDERLHVIEAQGTLLVPGLGLKYDAKSYFG